jgi:hypothetical protein
MKKKSDNIKMFIGKKIFNTSLIFCDICGSGNYLKYKNVYHNNRDMDFCNNHTDMEILNFIEMNLKSYSFKNPIDIKSLKNGQFKIDL